MLVLPVRGRACIDMPYRADNRAWLKTVCGRLTRPEWNKTTGRWEVARNHAIDLLEPLTERFGVLDLVRYGAARVKCDTRCWDATGQDCTCSCAGVNHGGGNDLADWIQVGDTTLIERGSYTTITRQTFTRAATPAPMARNYEETYSA